MSCFTSSSVVLINSFLTFSFFCGANLPSAKIFCYQRFLFLHFRLLSCGAYPHLRYKASYLHLFVITITSPLCNDMVSFSIWCLKPHCAMKYPSSKISHRSSCSALFPAPTSQAGKPSSDPTAFTDSSIASPYYKRWSTQIILRHQIRFLPHQHRQFVADDALP